MATEDSVDMLAKYCFVDALQDRQLQIHVKQAAPINVQEALAWAGEFEAFLECTRLVPSPPNIETSWKSCLGHRWARRAQTGHGVPQPGEKTCITPFKGGCFNCGQFGYKKQECKRRARSLEDSKRLVFKPCCWSYGMWGHKSPECRHPKEMVTLSGNAEQLGARATSQQNTPASQIFWGVVR